MVRMVVVAVVVVLTGCLPASVSAVRATGERLDVARDTRVLIHRTRVKADYLELGAYETREELASHPVWYPTQGDSRITDEDFFTIAGDPAALDATRRLHARGARWHRRGTFAVLGAAVLAAGALAIPSTTARAAGISLGVLGMAGGLSVMIWGARQTEPDVHAVDRSVAEQAARRYNEARGLALVRAF